MPFTVRGSAVYPDPNHWTEVYQGLIVPAVKEAGLACDRADSDVGSRLIVDDLLRRIEAADMVLCDLSGHNANVFLELGWALRGDKPYVLIHDELTEYTFDLNQQYTYRYRSSLQPTVVRTQVKELTHVVAQTLADGQRRYSVLARIEVQQSAATQFPRDDVVIGLLMEIRDRLDVAPSLYPVGDVARVEFPWPGLLRRATGLLAAAEGRVAFLGPSPSEGDVMAAVAETAREGGATDNPEVQVSLIDAEGRFLLHQWPTMVGKAARYLGIDRADMYEPILQSAHGAVAWEDWFGSPAASPKPRLRLNIAAFTTLQPLGWKLVAEVHSYPGGLTSTAAAARARERTSRTDLGTVVPNPLTPSALDE
jgi:hypothetical protein